MATTATDNSAERPALATSSAIEAIRRWLPLVSMLAVVLLALVLNAWHLSEVGFGNTYYAAAVRSMTLSWRNFAFGAFDPGGFITVDKPPVFLWVGALTARVFGYSSWTLLLPSAVAGAATVALVWLIVRRYFGAFAATIAGVALALTPITVAVDRLNLPEPFFILALVGAIGALLRSLESPRVRASLLWAALAGVLVGVAFNTKMLAAWIPGPAMVLALIIGVPWPALHRVEADEPSWLARWRPLWRVFLGRIVVFGVAALVVSLSWMVVTDRLVAASDRPYIGGSTDNSVQNLAFGYNGFSRVEGNQGPGSRGGNFAPPQGAQPQRTPPQTAPGNGAQNAPRGNTFGGANGPGGIIAGTPGPLRMFDAANGNQIAWLLPFALLGGAVSLWAARRQPVHRAAVVAFIGWVVLYAGVFSFARGIYHSYYTSALAPGIAALTGIAAASTVELVRRDRRWLFAVAACALVTLAVQFQLEARVPQFYGWMRPLVMLGVAAGLTSLSVLAWRRSAMWSLRVGMAVLVGALLLLPGGWSISEAANVSLNTTLPQAGPRGGAAGRTFGSQAFDAGTSQLAQWLHEHSEGTARYDLVVQSAMNASTMVAQDSLAVMPLGGFSGNDPAITLSKFADLVASGDVRYVLAGNAGPGGFGGGFVPNAGAPGGRGGTAQPNVPQGALPGFTPGGAGEVLPFDGAFGGRAREGRGVVAPSGAQPALPQAQRGGTQAVMSAVNSACTRVNDPTLPANYRNSLYDCSGKAEVLRARG